MKHPKWGRILETVRRAIERGMTERPAFIDRETSMGLGMRDEVAELVAAGDIDGPVTDLPDANPLGNTREFAELKWQLADRYEVLHVLGEGGMATVYRALDVRHDRQVAIKVLHRGVAERLGTHRFLREIKIAAGLRHPHILPLYDSGEAGNLIYYVMPVEGSTLRDRLDRDSTVGLTEAVQIIKELAGALDYAHAQGVVHRDIKPENILLSHGHPVIADFGIARAIRVAAEQTITQAGFAVGSPAYMSPEQIEATLEVDGRSDIYGLALVLYEILTGQTAFHGKNAQALMVDRIRTPTPELAFPPSVPGVVKAAIVQALHPDRERRPASGEAFVALLGAGTWGDQYNHAPTPARAQPTTRSLAVLPFVNLSGDPKDEYLSDGLTEAIINGLAQLPEVRVPARTSAFALKGSKLDIAEIAKKLNADTVLEGSVRTNEDRLRVTVQLINAADGYHVWSEQYDRHVKDMFAVEDEITGAVVDRLKLSLVGDRALVKPPTTDVEAYQLYLKGRHLWQKRSKTSLQQALRYYEEALERDPDFALAYSGVADAHILMGVYNITHSDEAVAKARVAVDRALELDDTLAEAYATKGLLLRTDRQWEAEAAAYEQALAWNPNYPTARQWYATHLTARGRFDEAIFHIQRAEELDPLSHAISVTAGTIYFMAREYERARAQLFKTLELEPNFASAHAWLSILHAHLGEYEEAAAAGARAAELAPDNLNVLAGMAYSYAVRGQRDKAMEVAKRVRAEGSAGWTAVIDGVLGRHDEAFELLEASLYAVESWDALFYIKVYPWMDPLRGDPRFASLLERLKIPD